MSAGETERARGPRNQLATYFIWIAALAGGLAIAWMDMRPTWDDTGVTAAALLAVAGLTALAGVRPWLAAVLVVAPLLIAETGNVGAGIVLAPVITIVGAYGGAMVRRFVAGSRADVPGRRRENAHMRADHEYVALFECLIADADRAVVEMQAADSQYARRVVFRNAFAFLEGELFGRKQLALLLHSQGRVEFSRSELVLLQEEQYDLDSSGSVRTQTKYLRFLDNVRFAFEMCTRAFGYGKALDVSGVGWGRLRSSVEVRNRLMHPKRISDLDVSSDEVRALNDAIIWYKNESVPLFASLAPPNEKPESRSGTQDETSI